MRPRRTAGRGASRTVISVAIPSVPSLPMNICNRSGPTERFATRLPEPDPFPGPEDDLGFADPPTRRAVAERPRAGRVRS